MSRISQPFTTRRTVLGVPVGKRRTNWAGVRKAAIAGAGVASAAAGGARVIRHGVPKVLLKLPGQVAGIAGTATKAVAGTATKAVTGTADTATGELRKTSGNLAGATGRLGKAAPERASTGRTNGRRATTSRPARAGSGAGRSGSARKSPAGRERGGGERSQQSTSKTTKRSSRS